MKIVKEKVTLTDSYVPYVTVLVDGQQIKVEVSPKLRADFKNQFEREYPTEGFRKRFKTLKSLMRAAYKAGQESV
jgi:hypothetical protein